MRLFGEKSTKTIQVCAKALRSIATGVLICTVMAGAEGSGCGGNTTKDKKSTKSVSAPQNVPMVFSPSSISTNTLASATRISVVSGGVPPYRWSTSIGTVDTTGSSVNFYPPISPSTGTITVTDSANIKATLSVTVVSGTTGGSGTTGPTGSSGGLSISPENPTVEYTKSIEFTISGKSANTVLSAVLTPVAGTYVTTSSDKTKASYTAPPSNSGATSTQLKITESQTGKTISTTITFKASTSTPGFAISPTAAPASIAQGGTTTTTLTGGTPQYKVNSNTVAQVTFSSPNVSGAVATINVLPAAPLGPASITFTDSASPAATKTFTFTVTSSSGIDPGGGSFPTYGTRSSGCYDSSQYDACLFYKDPVIANQQTNGQTSLSSPSYTSDLNSLQDYGVMLRDLKSPQNKLIDNNSVVTVHGDADINSSWSAITRANSGLTKSGSNWHYHYSLNCQGSTCSIDSTRSLEQVAMYFWLTEERLFWKKNIGNASLKLDSKRINVFPFVGSLGNNAFFTPTLSSPVGSGPAIAMGYSSFQTSSATKRSTAYDTSAALHEFGHGIFYFESTASFDNLSNNCPTTDGCIGGLHEGIADAISFITLHNFTNPVVGSFFANDAVNGLRNPQVDVSKPKSAFSTEIHDIGSFYSSVIWSIWSKLTTDADRLAFIRVFHDHLGGLGGNDNFVTEGHKLLSSDSVLNGGKFKQLICTAYQTTSPSRRILPSGDSACN